MNVCWLSPDTIRYMCRFRRVFFTLSFALYVVCGGRGYGQAPANASGVVVDFSAPPAIDRGLTRSLSRALDGPEAMIRASIRPEGFTLDRVGRTGAHYIAGKVIVKFRDGT